MCQLWIIFAVLLVSGLLGGWVTFILSDREARGALSWWHHLVVGVAASFMVPLFLNMISADLIDKIRGVRGELPDYSKLFVLAGFCLVAAISSRAFIRSMTHRLWKELEETNEKIDELEVEAKQAKAAAATAQDAMYEDKDKEEDPIDSLAAFAPSSSPITDGDELKVLDAMTKSALPLRSITGISKDSGLSKAVVNSALSALIAKGLVSQGKSASGQPRWFATPSGRIAASGATPSNG